LDLHLADIDPGDRVTRRGQMPGDRDAVAAAKVEDGRPRGMRARNAASQGP